MSQSFRVLLVEDDDSLRSCLVEFMTSQGWDVRATAFAAEALNMARRQRFDFSLMDFHLPGMTGLQLFKQLATQGHRAALGPLPTILMSGLATPDETAAAHHAGFFAFLRKPLELEHLRRSLEQLIQAHFGGPLAPVRLPQPLQSPPPPSRPQPPRHGR